MRRLLAFFLTLTLLGSSTALPPTALASHDYDIPGGHFFTQTAGGETGFSVTDADGVRFWSEFQRLGGVNGVGYPVSRRFLWSGFVTQAMQRVVFQWRPDLNQVLFVNVFDLFSDAGQDDRLLASRSVPKPLPPSFDAGKSFPEVIQARLALLDANPAIRTAYNAVPGDPLTMNGLPTSPVTDMGNHFALRTQRVLFQQWKVAVPWANAGDVTVALGGSIAAELGVFPTEVIEPETVPGETRPLVTVPLPASTPPPPPTARTVPLGYGFQIDPSEGYERAQQLTRDAGFGWMKYQTRWEEFEPQPGNFQFGFLDRVVGGAQNANLKLLLSVVAAPGWARPGQDLSQHGPPTDPQTYARFVNTLAARYKGRLHAIEVWNEQNLGREWGGPGKQSAPAYAALLRAAYAAIKAADPAIQVITGAPTPAGNVNIPELGGMLARDDIEYLQEMYDAGIKGFYDGVGVHPSGFNNAPDLDPRDPSVLGRPGGFHGHRSFYFRNFEFYREVMERNGEDAKGLWFTEFGWASGGQAGAEWSYAQENTEANQAEWLAQAFRIGKDRHYIAAMFVWNLNFFGIDQAKRAFAVINPDWSPRPAYTALRGLAK